MRRTLRKLETVRLTKADHLLPPRIRIGDRLPNKSNPRDTPASEYDRVLRAAPTFFEYPAFTPAPTVAAQSHHDYYDTETKLIWAGFDVPEKVSVVLRDRLIAGDREAFSPRWLDAALHWVKEGRYWRCIGIERPFYEPTILRANAWAKVGTDVGNIQMSAAMVDALRDLERAVRRTAEGLPADYYWDKWGPGGMIDGSRTQTLPRFRHNQVVDPDGIDVTPEDVAEYKTHDQIKERYSQFIFPDTAPLEKAFLAPTNGSTIFLDFEEGLRARVAELRGMPEEQCVKLSSADDIRTMIYLAALPSLDEALDAATSWEDVVNAVKPLREKYDLMIDAARLFSASRGVDELRTFYEEKCGFADFTMTPDKALTAATIVFLQDCKHIVETQEWGQALASAVFDSERNAVMGAEAFSVYRELLTLDRDHMRRAWNARFTGEANEEASLDYMLQNFARRVERPAAVANEPGEDFDREAEPIGRKVQRRVLESDKAINTDGNSGSSVDRLNKFREQIRQRRADNELKTVKYNQLVRTSQL